MSNRDYFIASAVSWFIDKADDVEEQINSQLKYQLEDSTVVVWRSEGVANGLVRWDDRHPDKIFQDGFQPRAVPPAGQPIRYGLVDLWRYVKYHDLSVFVSTTRPYREGTEEIRWQPKDVTGLFEYRVYAYGGIDTNATLGGHDFVHQHEISFPGGIRRPFIYCARQYDTKGNVTRVWINKASFDLMANGPRHEVPLFRLPDVLNWSVGVQIVNWLAPGKYEYYHKLPTDLQPATSLSVTSSAGDTIPVSSDPMQGPGADMPDPLTSTSTLTGEASAVAAPETDPMWGPGKDTVDPFLSRVPIRSSLSISPYGVTGQAWFFTDDKCARVTIDGSDKLVSGPDSISSAWKSLKALNFSTVDACLPIKGGAWVFSGDKYGRIAINNKLEDSKVSGPTDIATGWPSLAKAGLRRVSAVLLTAKADEAWVFHGRLSVRIKFSETSNTLISGPDLIVDKWASLKKAGFDTVDCALPTSDPNVAWFFKGTRYVQVDVAKDQIKKDVNYVCHDWQSLVKAKFY